MSRLGYSEDALVEQPAIALLSELHWETANCFHEFEQPGWSPLGRDLLLTSLIAGDLDL